MKRVAALAFALLMPLSATWAQGSSRLGVNFNQTYIESLTADAGLDVGNMSAVFGEIFAALPDQVKVYPTENYFYFTFAHKGVIYAGNMRLDVKDRDEGVLHFAYFNQSEDWNTELLTRYKPLSAIDGIKVARVDAFHYNVTYRTKTVAFELNDLRDMKPPAAIVGEGETYLGPVFDESGARFFLMFHRADKRFMFVLDETVGQIDEIIAYSPNDPDIMLGMRTGFAFYKDRFLPRKILIGVFAGNVENNNYFDGPFDQLPDNFIKGNELQDAILTVYPELKDQIDRYGNFKEQEGRVLVNPYINYAFLNELEAYRRCASPDLDRVQFYKCLQPPEEQR